MGFCYTINGRRPYFDAVTAALILFAVLVPAAVTRPLSNAEAQRIIMEQQQKIEADERERSARSSLVVKSSISTTGAPSTLQSLAAAPNVDNLKSMLEKVNNEIVKREERKRLIDVALKNPSEVENAQLRTTLQLFQTIMSPESRQRFKDDTNRQLEQLIIERTHILSRMAETLRQTTPADRPDETRYGNRNKTKADRLFEAGEDRLGGSTALHQSNSRLICQFLAFGTIFSVVCTISACTWSLSKNNHVDNASNVFNSISRLTQTPEPFDSTKPYCLKVDEKGQCYASPLAGDEVPPLPGYQEAVRMSKSVETLFEQTSQTPNGDTSQPKA